MELIIEPKDFKVILIARFPGQTASHMAAELGITRAAVSLLLQGARKPSTKLLGKLGFEVVYRDKWGRVITQRGMPDYLMGRFPGTDEEIAKQLGVGKQLASLLRTGKRMPSAAILKKCGLEVVYRAVPPEKGKK